MKSNIYTLWVLVVAIMCGLPYDSTARSKKKKTKKGEITAPVVKQETPYEKLFSGKDVKTSEGLMKVHMVNGTTVYLEIPANLLGKDMMYFATIDKSSDTGEGYIGDRSRASFGFRFVKEDKQINMQSLDRKLNSEDENIKRALKVSDMDVTLFSYPVKATTPDSSAYVIDITEFVLGDSPRTNPFPAGTGNSLNGLLAQTSSYQRAKSHLSGIRAGDCYASIQAELAYNVAGQFGNLSTASRVLQMYVSRHFMLLPENEMEVRPADPRINLSAFATSEISSDTYISTIYKAIRWNLQPSDREAYQAGKLVDPVKPIVFYIDTLMPVSWKKGVIRGMLEWNKAFEAIGFKDVIQVKDVPADKNFDIDDPYISVIHYAIHPAYSCRMNTTVDLRTGEIMSASLIIPSGVADAIQIIYNMTAMVHEPEVRQRVLPEDKFVDLLQGRVADYMGTLLGFKDNYTALGAYSVENLRSPEFTQKHGLYPSIVGNSGVYNYIAQPEDVAKGTRLYQKGIGEYDYFAVKCLYQPMDGCSTMVEKSKRLDEWIAAVVNNPVYHFRQAQFGDISSRSGVLSSEPVKASEYRIKNLKIVAKNFMKWYADDDRETGIRSRINGLLISSLWATLDANDGFIGGMVFNDDYALKNNFPMYTFVPKKTQELAVKTNLKNLRDVSWLYVKEIDELLFKDFARGMTYNSCLGRLLKRVAALEAANQLCTDPNCIYPLEDYVRELYNFMFEKTKKGQKMTHRERNVQAGFLQQIIATAQLNEFIGTPPKKPGIPGFGLRDIEQSGINEAETLLNIQPVFNQNVSTPVAAYKPRGRDFPIQKYPVAPLFFKLLQETKSLMEQRVVSSTGDLKLHYKYCLYLINTALKEKK